MHTLSLLPLKFLNNDSNKILKEMGDVIVIAGSNKHNVINLPN